MFVGKPEPRVGLVARPIPHPALVLAGVLALAASGSAACRSPTAPSDPPITITGTGATTLTYTADVQPILATDCVQCHGPAQQQAGHNFSTYAGVLRALVPGSDASRIVRVTQPGGRMYNNLTGNRNQKAGIIYDWVVNSRAAQ